MAGLSLNLGAATSSTTAPLTSNTSTSTPILVAVTTPVVDVGLVLPTASSASSTAATTSAPTPAAASGGIAGTAAVGVSTPVATAVTTALAPVAAVLPSVSAGAGADVTAGSAGAVLGASVSTAASGTTASGGGSGASTGGGFTDIVTTTVDLGAGGAHATAPSTGGAGSTSTGGTTTTGGAGGVGLDVGVSVGAGTSTGGAAGSTGGTGASSGGTGGSIGGTGGSIGVGVGGTVTTGGAGAGTGGSGGGSTGGGSSGGGGGTGGAAGGAGASAVPDVATAYANLFRLASPGEIGAEARAQLDVLQQQVNGGALTPAQAVLKVADLAIGSLSVAVTSYQFFTGLTPTSAGLDYLVHSAANPADLGDSYYTRFNTENRYINFASNLGLHSDAAPGFAQVYGAMTFQQAVATAYDRIVGSAEAVQAGINPQAAVADIVSRQSYFSAVAHERFGGENQDLSTKLAAIAYILEESVKANVGRYGHAEQNFLFDLADGKAQFHVDLVGVYGGSAGPTNLTF